MVLQNKRIKKVFLENDILYEHGYDYYISTTGSNDNNGKTLQTAFADLTPLTDIVENGDSVYVESGNYVIAESINLTKAITLESSYEDPAIFTINSGVYWGLVFDLREESGFTINLNNIYFNKSGTGDAGGVRIFLGNSPNSNCANVNNCSFDGFKRRWAGGALEFYSENANNEMMVTNSSFINNVAYSFGHLGSCLTVTGHYGKLRVYNCIFNNPSGDSMKFCGTKGRAIGACVGDDTVYVDCKGSCNQFLGTGDGGCFKNYIEETCNAP